VVLVKNQIGPGAPMFDEVRVEGCATTQRKAARYSRPKRTTDKSDLYDVAPST
jgi:hypothetical protein